MESKRPGDLLGCGDFHRVPSGMPEASIRMTVNHPAALIRAVTPTCIRKCYMGILA